MVESILHRVIVFSNVGNKTSSNLILDSFFTSGLSVNLSIYFLFLPFVGGPYF